jgi:hypothetical protein
MAKQKKGESLLKVENKDDLHFEYNLMQYLQAYNGKCEDNVYKDSFTLLIYQQECRNAIETSRKKITILWNEICKESRTVVFSQFGIMYNMLIHILAIRIFTDIQKLVSTDYQNMDNSVINKVTTCANVLKCIEPLDIDVVDIDVENKTGSERAFELITGFFIKKTQKERVGQINHDMSAKKNTQYNYGTR